MTTFTRRNAWDNNGTFDNKDLYWYAKAVQVMQSRPITDSTSWWFYAGIHGQYLLKQFTAPRPGDPDNRYLNWPNVKYISAAAQISSIPSKNLTDLFWDQCQHGTWFFPPWHRGYLVALENILRDIIVQLKGPGDWALPYWNYFNKLQSNIPTAFTVSQLPDGTQNCLLVSQRYGSNVDVGNGIEEAHDLCQWDTIYNEGATQTPTGLGNITGYFYGGGETGFMHDGYSERGDLEENPHNAVHGMVGGENSSEQSGLMGVPNTAALDPVFYLHHSNIDRMWAAWNEEGKNNNSDNPNWLSGPVAQGNSLFVMPLDSNGSAWYYSPNDVQSTTNLKYNKAGYSYTYDDLSLTSYNTTRPAQIRKTLLERFDKLGVTDDQKKIVMSKDRNTELVGASTGPITLNRTETNTEVTLQSAAWKQVSDNLLKASLSAIPDEVYIELEGVKGGRDTNFLSVYVNEKFVKSVSLFGILDASMKDSAHGGGGLNFKFNITDIIDDMHIEGKIDVDSLNVQIKTKHAPNKNGITIDRIGVYRSGQ
jgi:tyrosinase